MLGELDHLASQQLQGPAGTPLGWAGAGGCHQQRLLFAGKFARRTGAWLFAQGQLEIAFDEAALSAIYGRAADRDIGRDRRIALACIGGEQDLRPLQLAGCVPATAQHLVELIALLLVQLHSIPYIHRRSPDAEGADESDVE